MEAFWSNWTKQARIAIQELIDGGAETFAVAFLWSFAIRSTSSALVKSFVSLRQMRT